MPIERELASWLKTLDFSRGEALGTSNQGEVRRFRFDALDLAVKAPKGRGLPRWLRLQSLRREYEVYRQLEGVPGFARCYGLFHDRFLVLDFIAGSDFRNAELPDRAVFFDRLLESIRAMHQHGIAHGDLKRKDNLRVSETGSPVILDLGTAVRRKPGGGLLNRRLFDFIRQTDLNAWIKLKYGRYSDIPAEDADLLRRSRLERSLSRWWPGRR
jgi:serine/threonine protein kinase